MWVNLLFYLVVYLDEGLEVNVFLVIFTLHTVNCEDLCNKITSIMEGIVKSMKKVCSLQEYELGDSRWPSSVFSHKACTLSDHTCFNMPLITGGRKRRKLKIFRRLSMIMLIRGASYLISEQGKINDKCYFYFSLFNVIIPL